MAAAAYNRDAPIMVGDRVEVLKDDGTVRWRGFAVSRATLNYWRVLVDDDGLEFVSVANIRRETVDPWDAGNGR